MNSIKYQTSSKIMRAIGYLPIPVIDPVIRDPFFCCLPYEGHNFNLQWRASRKSNN